jgi:hypothetical protein
MIGVKIPGKMGLPWSGMIGSLLGNTWSAGTIAWGVDIAVLTRHVL